MNNLLIMLIGICSLWTKNDKPYQFTWESSNAKANQVYKREVSPNKVLLPFLWTEVDKISIDSLIAIGVQYENVESPNKYPILNIDGKPVLNFMSRKIIKVQNCAYDVIIFEAVKGSSFDPDNNYWLYYFNGVGFITAEDRFSWNPPPYERIDLINANNKKGKGLIDTSRLRKLITASVESNYKKRQ